MSGVLWAIIGEVLIGTSLTVDKFLLENKLERTLPYVFWIGILSLFGALLIPFGFIFPSAKALLICFASAVAFLITLSCVYSALTRGGATSTLPIIGGFSPIAAYLVSSLVLFAPFNIADKIAFILLVFGGFLLFFSEKFDLKRLLPWIVGAAVFTGINDTLQRLAFNEGNFVSIYATIKIFVFLIAASALLFKPLRKKIFAPTKAEPKKARVLYIINRLASGFGSFFIYYAFSQTPQPALIESLSGVRYTVIFIIVLIAAKFVPAFKKEKMSGYPLVLKIIATIFIFTGLAGISAQKYYELKPLPANDAISWGVTFSEQMSKQFGLKWKENYSAILSDLKPKYIRLIAYWYAVEPKPDEYDFADLDWQVEEASKAGTQIILTVGQRVPRWPECHFPSWVDPNSAEKNERLLSYVKKVVEHYRDNKNIIYWQVENEPFLIFGNCPASDSVLIDKELALVRATDPSHKIYLTDGGEFGDWYRASSRADIFGPTLYRKVHTKLFGYISWPLTPQFYPLHRDVTRFLTGKTNQEFIISELGLEPWMVKQIYEVDIPTQLSFFNTTDFKNTVSYAKQTGFTTFYTWGAEWWYYLKTQGNNDFWNMAKDLFAGKNI